MLAVLLAGFWFGGVSIAAEASIWGVSYDSLVDAIAQANGKTVKLENNVSLTNTLMIENTTMTLDLNGYNIEKTNWNVIFVGTNGNLTIEWTWFVWIPTDNNDGTAIVVKSWWKATINNWSYQGWTAVYAYGTDSEVTINSWNFIGTKSWNRAAIHSVVYSLITINWWIFTAQPTDSWKPQKVIYAWANTNKCNTPSTTDANVYIPWKIIVNGWYLKWRFSRSNLWEYEIKSWTLEPYQDKTAWVWCDYNACTSGSTADPVSCKDVPGVTSMLNEWYVATPKTAWVYIISYDPVATIWENGYSTVTWAIAAATEWQTVEILKAWTYDLPATISHKITIEWAVAGVKFAHGVTSTTDQIISTINEDVIFSWITFVFNWSAAQHHFAQADGKKIIMNNCIIDGIFHVRWAVDFIWCTFKREEATPLATNLYNLHLNYWNVNFDSCTFTNNNSKNINIAYWWDATYNIDFKNTQFSYTVWDPNKPAVLIHEVYKKIDYRYPNLGSVDTYTTWGIDYVKWKWNITFDSATKVNSTYGSTFVWGSQLFGLEDVYSENGVPAQGSSTEELYGSTNWWEVVVSINWTTVYSTPKHGQTWAVTFDWTWAVEVADGAKVAQPADPSKSCYHFDEWQLNGVAYDFNSVVTGKLALTSKWTYTCWWGGGSSKKTSTTKVDDNKTTTEEVNTEDKTEENNDEAKTEETLPQLASQEELQNPEAQDWYDNEWDQQEVLEYGLTREMHNAYEFAVRAGITTMPSATEADMLSPLNRIAMAKMLVYYAINVLWMTPDTSKEVPNFWDVSEQLNKDYGNAVTLAYQLGIMWIGITDFRPFDEVPRMEFATALSRMLYGTADGEGDNYYEPHLQKLMSEWIITNDNPRLEELRGYVMIMLMRSANK